MQTSSKTVSFHKQKAKILFQKHQNDILIDEK